MTTSMNKVNFNAADREIRLEPKNLVFKFSKDLKLEYVNGFFAEFTGYEIEDVIGLSAEDLNYKELPKTIINIIDRHIADKKNINLILKNEIMDGRFYWFLTDYVYKKDKEGNLDSITYYRKMPYRKAIPFLDELYTRLNKIEKHTSLKIAEKYLEGFLEEKKMSLDEYTRFLIRGERPVPVVKEPIKPKKEPIKPKKVQPKKVQPKKKKTLLKKIFGK